MNSGLPMILRSSTCLASMPTSLPSTCLMCGMPTRVSTRLRLPRKQCNMPTRVSTRLSVLEPSNGEPCTDYPARLPVDGFIFPLKHPSPIYDVLGSSLRTPAEALTLGPCPSVDVVYGLRATKSAVPGHAGVSANDTHPDTAPNVIRSTSTEVDEDGTAAHA